MGCTTAHKVQPRWEQSNLGSDLVYTFLYAFDADRKGLLPSWTLAVRGEVNLGGITFQNCTGTSYVEVYNNYVSGAGATFVTSAPFRICMYAFILNLSSVGLTDSQSVRVCSKSPRRRV